MIFKKRSTKKIDSEDFQVENKIHRRKFLRSQFSLKILLKMKKSFFQIEKNQSFSFSIGFSMKIEIFLKKKTISKFFVDGFSFRPKNLQNQSFWSIVFLKIIILARAIHFRSNCGQQRALSIDVPWFCENVSFFHHAHRAFEN